MIRRIRSLVPSKYLSQHSIPTTMTIPLQAPSRALVRSILTSHLANLRSEPLTALESAYDALAPGYHFVFERELALPQGVNGADEPSEIRAVQLVGYEDLVRGLRDGGEAIKVLARLYEKGRGAAVRAARNEECGMKPLIVNVGPLVENADARLGEEIVVREFPGRCEMEAHWAQALELDFTKLGQASDLGELPKLLGLKHELGACAFYGGGGGSDVVQAAAGAMLIQKAVPGVEIVALGSTRTHYSKSRGVNSKEGETRTVWDEFGKEVVPNEDGYISIKPEYTGNGRYIEGVPANDFDVSLILDDKIGSLERGILGTLKKNDGVKTLFGIDSGGDVLGGLDRKAKRKTPDQDLRTQLALREIAIKKDCDAVTMIVALGVDAPADSQEKLEKSNAIVYTPSAEEIQFLHDQYKEWHMDGTVPDRCGKTPFALLASLDGLEGYQALPLPRHLVDNYENPWECIVRVTKEMRSFVFINQEDLFRVIALPEP